MQLRALAPIVALAIGALLATGCGDKDREEHKAEHVAGEAGRALEDAAEGAVHNVEDSARVEGESYRKAREKGEGRVEAAGDAYEAVLEIPEEEGSKPKKKD